MLSKLSSERRDAYFLPKLECIDFVCDSPHSYLYADYLSGQWEHSDSNAPTEIKGGV